jgi:hypothetical protein
VAALDAVIVRVAQARRDSPARGRRVQDLVIATMRHEGRSLSAARSRASSATFIEDVIAA